MRETRRGCVTGVTAPVAVVTVTLGLAVLATVLVLAVSRPAPDLYHPAVTGSAGATVAWVLATWLGLVVGATGFARLAWTLGLLTLLVHVAAAIALAHGGSHAAAVERIREVGGSGGGILVNYLFAAVWGADVLWWWLAPANHSRRSRWASWIVHGFAAFMVVNGTVVFGPPYRRWLYAAALAFVAAAWLRSRRRASRNPRPPADRPEPPVERPGPAAVENPRPPAEGQRASAGSRPA